jgi:HTH-type transcriptional regulator/antitoxin HigA
LHDRKKLTFINTGPGIDTFEREADDFAARTLIPRELAAQLPALDTVGKIEAFADLVGVATGIVIGRLQHERYIRHDQLNHLRTLLKFSDEA